MRVILLIVFLTTQILAVKNELTDTSSIMGFSGTNTVYSKAFNLSDAENLTVEIIVRDTTVAGVSNDSSHFYYWIELGRQLGSGYVWDRVNPILIDTFNMTVSARRTITFRPLGTDGTYEGASLTVDTAAVPGWGYQRRPITIEAAGVFRIGHTGLVTNNKDAPLELMDLIWRRVYTISRER